MYVGPFSRMKFMFVEFALNIQDPSFVIFWHKKFPEITRPPGLMDMVIELTHKIKGR